MVVIHSQLLLFARVVAPFGARGLVILLVSAAVSTVLDGRHFLVMLPEVLLMRRQRSRRLLHFAEGLGE